MFLNLDKYVEEFSNQTLYYKFLFIGGVLGLFFTFLGINRISMNLINYFNLLSLFNSISYFLAVYPLILGTIGAWFSYNCIKNKSRGLYLGISIMITGVLWFFIANGSQIIVNFPMNYFTCIYPFILSIIGVYFSKKHLKSGIFIAILSVLMLFFNVDFIPIGFLLTCAFLMGISLLIFLSISFLKRNLEIYAIVFVISSILSIVIFTINYYLYYNSYSMSSFYPYFSTDVVYLYVSSLILFIIPSIFIVTGSILMLKNSSKVHISELIDI